MKKAYATPTLVTSGNVVTETLSGSGGSSENGFTKQGAGGVGFYL